MLRMSTPRRPSTRAVIAIVLASVSVPAAPALAQSWTTISSGTNTPNLVGSLLGNSISISSSFPSGTPATGTTLAAAPGINPPFNSYCLWDSTLPENSAQLWPASAASPSCAEQIIVGLSSAATIANPLRVAVTFGRPVLNPKMMIYSFDNSAMNLSATRDMGGNPAVLAVTFNNAGVYNAAAQTFGTVGIAPIPEGCANNPTPGRACAYVTFVGTYSQLAIDFNLTSGGSDGIGFTFGADASVPVQLQSFQID